MKTKVYWILVFSLFAVAIGFPLLGFAIPDVVSSGGIVSVIISLLAIYQVMHFASANYAAEKSGRPIQLESWYFFGIVPIVLGLFLLGILIPEYSSYVRTILILISIGFAFFVMFEAYRSMKSMKSE